MRRRNGFTLTELLVVIALIAMLIAIVLVAVTKLRESAQMLECQSNQHQLQVGLVGYSMENGGKFISPRTSSLNGLPTNLLWVRSYNGDDVTRLDPTTGLENINALEDGALWDYVGDDAAYRSPLDPTGRLRSYSLNGFISDQPDNDANPNAAWAPVADRLSKIKNPANTIYTIPEDDGEPFNLHGWVLQTNSNEWIDYPVNWLPEATTTVSFVDGSTRIIEYRNPNLIQQLGDHWAPVTNETTSDFQLFSELVRVDR